MSLGNRHMAINLVLLSHMIIDYNDDNNNDNNNDYYDDNNNKSYIYIAHVYILGDDGGL